jgi:hypothetical protein
MDKFWKSAHWLTRLILLPPTLILTLIAFRHIAHPVAAAAAQGITLPTALGVTIARVGLGGFPLGCAIFMVTCLVSTRRLLTGLNFVAILIGVVLVVRIFAMNADATVHENVKLVNAEIGLLAVTGLGFFVELRRRAYLRRTHSELETREWI